jgi:hypothetical protein
MRFFLEKFSNLDIGWNERHFPRLIFFGSAAVLGSRFEEIPLRVSGLFITA